MDTRAEIKDVCIGIIVFYTALFFLLYLCSCRATRQAETHATCIDRASIVHTSCTEAQSLEATYQRWAQSQWSDLHIHMRIYDTDQPPDSTGHHPMLADIDITKADSANAQLIETARIQATTTDTAKADSSHLSYKNKERQTDTRAGSDSWQIYAALITIIACLAIFAWGQGWLTRHRT